MAGYPVNRNQKRLVYPGEFPFRQKFLYIFHAGLRHDALPFRQINPDIIIHRFDVKDILQLDIGTFISDLQSYAFVKTGLADGTSTDPDGTKPFGNSNRQKYKRKPDLGDSATDFF